MDVAEIGSLVEYPERCFANPCSCQVDSLDLPLGNLALKNIGQRDARHAVNHALDQTAAVHFQAEECHRDLVLNRDPFGDVQRQGCFADARAGGDHHHIRRVQSTGALVDAFESRQDAVQAFGIFECRLDPCVCLERDLLGAGAGCGTAAFDLPHSTVQIRQFHPLPDPHLASFIFQIGGQCLDSTRLFVILANFQPIGPPGGGRQIRQCLHDAIKRLNVFTACVRNGDAVHVATSPL